MMFHTLLTCSLMIALVGGQRYPKSIDVQRRMGYSGNVVHVYPSMPGYNDLRAESSVNVNIPLQQQLTNNPNKGRVKYTHVMPHGQQGVPFHAQHGGQYHAQQYHHMQPGSQFYAQPGGQFHAQQGGHNHNGQPSHFNVGYNLKFKEDASNKYLNRYPPHQVTGKKFENAEVIRGTMKNNEKVRAPGLGSDLSPQQFVSQAYLKQKQLASARPSTPQIKYATTSNREQTQRYPSGPGFNYNTQQNIFKDVVRATRPEPSQPLYDNNKWESITSSSSGDHTHTEEAIEPEEYEKVFGKPPGDDNQAFGSFNHDIALRNSESFDFSNVHGEISFGESNNRQFVDNVSAGSDRHSTTVTTAGGNVHSSFNDAHAAALQGVKPLSLDVNRLKNPSSFVGNAEDASKYNVNIEAHIPENLKGVKPLPLDTSLLKDPVLTTSPTNNQDPSKFGKVIPIHFDVRQIQAAMQEELSKAQKYAPYGGQQAQTFNPSGYAAQQNAVNYNEDPYKIVSLRPPSPQVQNLGY